VLVVISEDFFLFPRFFELDDVDPLLGSRVSVEAETWRRAYARRGERAKS
jgi:hypothetical protein